ncbi:hypothetical protein A4X06_0g8830 [Tilletia controversa]|uniref:Uncharacterized protein n=2 Tax=Tilletia TaxID=13289 RepID=A0A8X7SSW8_9BASI|nr:hypothetical protein CF328_g8325 [Tilletia controversa]KAE8238355.1 hypothetical protein A4X06_0g8830 [Tilletia controversa]
MSHHNDSLSDEAQRAAEGSIEFTRAGMDALADLQQSFNVMNARFNGLQTRLNEFSRQPQNDQDSATQGSDRGGSAATVTFANTNAQQLPPHMLGTTPQTSRPSTTTSPSVQIFRKQSDGDKAGFRRVLLALGMRSSDVLDDEQLLARLVFNSLFSNSQFDTSTFSDAEAAPSSEHPHTSTPAKKPSSTDSTTLPSRSTDDSIKALSAAQFYGRAPVCKKEFLGEFNGDPTKLEEFLGCLQDVLRSDDHPGWEQTVLRTLSRALTGEAAS